MEVSKASPAFRLGGFGSLDQNEMESLKQLVGPERFLEKGDVLWREGERLPGIYLMLEGWAASMRLRADGRQQMLKVHLPGDTLGLPSLAFDAAVETLVALTPLRVRPIPLHSFGYLFDAHPRLAALLFLVSQEERVALLDRFILVVNATIVQRVAAGILQLHGRLIRGNPTLGESFHVPLTRQDLADITGVAIADLQRTLEELRAASVVGWSGDLITIADPTALQQIADMPKRALAKESYWLPASG